MCSLLTRTILSAAILLVLSPLSSLCQEDVQTAESEKKFSKRECRQAVHWTNRDLTLLMGSGVVKRISTQKEKYDVFVGDAWYALAFDQQGDILKHLSRSRQIMGHSPFLNLYDHETGQLVAFVQEKNINILYQNEGFFQYLVHGQKPENTLY